MAISYPAKSPSGEKVFFKQYKSPSVTVPWYKAYVAYQAEMKRRLESSDAARFCYKFVDFFEAKAGSQCYFQVYEFVEKEKGGDLGKILDELRSGKSPLGWDQLLIFARVLMAGIAKVHKTGIVHCDLKPENIQMIKDSSVKAGYALKLIDMDYSILQDRRAPWHGHMGYIGSPNYMSPEHLVSPPPTSASDVFTCSLILHELLADGHPYRSDDQEEYKKAALAHKAPRPKFKGEIPNAKTVAEVMHRSLSPDPSRRPTAVEFLQALRAEAKTTSLPKITAMVPSPTPADAAPPASEFPKTPEPAPSKAAGNILRLIGPDGKEIRIGVRTEVGKSMLRGFGDDSRYTDDLQFTVETGTPGTWVVIPRPATTNETLLNGKAIAERTPINDGDILAVGREAKGIVKLPMTIRVG